MGDGVPCYGALEIVGLLLLLLLVVVVVVVVVVIVVIISGMHLQD